MPSKIALIPARRGSKRLPGKNMALLNGKPLLGYALYGAKKSGIFEKIVVSTDWDAAEAFALDFGVEVVKRPPGIAQDLSHDYEWVSHALEKHPGFDVFAILRPTSPFRTPGTISRAMDWFLADPPCDSLRAVEPTRAHPGKSWILHPDGLMSPYEWTNIHGFPSYDLATQALDQVFCQNGCIHIAWTDTLRRFGNVSGQKIKAFFTRGYEGLDINSKTDFSLAEMLIEKGIAFT